MSTSNIDQSKLASIKTYMLIAFIFGLIAVILFVIAGILQIVSYATLAAYYAALGYTAGSVYWNYYVGPALTGAIASGIAFIVIGAIGVYIFFFRIRPMYTASKTGDTAKLKSLNSMLWAILCLIFTGVLPGIMMLIAFGPINELGKASPPPPPPPS